MFPKILYYLDCRESCTIILEYKQEQYFVFFFFLLKYVYYTENGEILLILSDILA